jgi:putative tryptophan/tyrosine transport system substrate-binding protein
VYRSIDELQAPPPLTQMTPCIGRRDFITLLGGAAAAWPLTARAQQPAMPVIGFLNSASPDGMVPFVAAFRQGLKEAGYVEGQNVTIEYRWAEGNCDRLPALAADLVNRKVTAIAATSTPAARAAKAATATVPIVFTTGGDPIKLGLVAALNRPGGNATGVSSLITELGSKRLGLLRELVPGITAIATLTNPNFQDAETQVGEADTAVRALGLRLIVLRATSEREIDAAFEMIAQQGAAALDVAVDPFFAARRDRIVALAARYRIPAVYPMREFAVAGGLMSYGTDFVDSYRQAGVYTGRIIRGENPADLPVQRSTKFELVINFKTAKALGLAVPNSMQLLADEVIEGGSK